MTHMTNARAARMKQAGRVDPLATFIKQIAWRSDARLYRLLPPIRYGDNEDKTTEYVIVSGVSNEWATETYIFPADSEGNAIEMLALEGSFQGSVNHKAALIGAGYRMA